jgi:hypothetical protein
MGGLVHPAARPTSSTPTRARAMACSLRIAPIPPIYWARVHRDEAR